MIKDVILLRALRTPFIENSKSINMQFSTNIFFWLFGAFLLLCLGSACEQEEDTLPITNDFRVLRVDLGGDRINPGETDVSVLPALEIVFSHGLNTAAFEGALQVSPAADYTISYGGNNSFAAFTFNTPLDYETAYTITLPAGTYGAGGESSTEPFSFNFTTEAFALPSISLASDATGFFEGETLTLTATLGMSILQDVGFDLSFTGSAVLDEDFTASATSLTIPAGSTQASVTLTGLNDAGLEGEETVGVVFANLVNAREDSPQQLSLTLGDTPPALAMKGVMSLKIGGDATNGRAVHLRVLEDIADLSQYGLGIANNGGGSDGREIDFPAGMLTAGDDILLVRDVDEAGLAAYFGDCYADFELVIPSGGLNFNGDDPIELYQGQIAIETYGDVELSGGGLEWEYTGSWAYKLKGVWEYAPVDCSANATTVLETSCSYPFCTPLQLQGVMALLWDGSGTNGGKAVHVRANRDIADLSLYGLGVANNGGGTDGQEFTYPAESVREGDHILVAREPASLAAYFGACYGGYDLVIQADAMNQNGDDAIELFQNMTVVQTYGDADVDGTDQAWDYAGTWAYKSGGVFRAAAVDCATTSTTTQNSSCVYGFCE
jgi:hypothetical protein